MSKNAGLWTPLPLVLDREKGFTQWDIAELIPPDLDATSIEVHEKRIQHYADKVTGLGSLSVATTTLNNTETSQALLRRSDIDRKLPSSYQHPDGTLLINTAPFAKRLEPKDTDKDYSLETVFAKKLNYVIGMGIGSFFGERYTKPSAMNMQERILSPMPFYVGFAADIFASAPIYHSLPLAVAAYGLITISDYLDARKVLGEDPQPSVWERKRWSISACGVPLDRRFDATFRAIDAIHPKPRLPLVRYTPAA